MTTSSRDIALVLARETDAKTKPSTSFWVAAGQISLSSLFIAMVVGLFVMSWAFCFYVLGHNMASGNATLELLIVTIIGAVSFLCAFFISLVFQPVCQLPTLVAMYPNSHSGTPQKP